MDDALRPEGSWRIPSRSREGGSFEACHYTEMAEEPCNLSTCAGVDAAIIFRISIYLETMGLPYEMIRAARAGVPFDGP